MIGDDDLRDCFAMFAMLGFIMADQGEASERTAMSAYELADQMLEARSKREPEIGIVAVKSRRRK